MVVLELKIIDCNYKLQSLTAIINKKGMWPVIFYLGEKTSIFYENNKTHFSSIFNRNNFIFFKLNSVFEHYKVVFCFKKSLIFPTFKFTSTQG